MSDESARFSDAVALATADENALLRQSLAGAFSLAAEAEAAAFRRELTRVVAQAARHGTPAALLDIRLTGLSEAPGVESGARAVAELLAELIRATDFLARTGECRFGLLLDHLDQDSAIDAADRLVRCITVGVPGARAVIAVTGILAGDSVADVLARAERNMAAAQAEA
ncbi:MAG TPA: hypothetical protein VHM92_01975 [Allosphingosinicella sp.]|nr:hypothetical protein [Allosphingosinicella sp.]